MKKLLLPLLLCTISTIPLQSNVLTTMAKNSGKVLAASVLGGYSIFAAQRIPFLTKTSVIAKSVIQVAAATALCYCMGGSTRTKIAWAATPVVMSIYGFARSYSLYNNHTGPIKIFKTIQREDGEFDTPWTMLLPFNLNGFFKDLDRSKAEQKALQEQE